MGSPWKVKCQSAAIPSQNHLLAAVCDGENGASAEIAVVGNKGGVGISLFQAGLINYTRGHITVPDRKESWCTDHTRPSI